MLPVLGSFLSCRRATQWIVSYVLLNKTWYLQRESMFNGAEGVGLKGRNYTATFLPDIQAQEEMMERLSNYCKIDHTEAIE